MKVHVGLQYEDDSLPVITLHRMHPPAEFLVRVHFEIMNEKIVFVITAMR